MIGKSLANDFEYTKLKYKYHFPLVLGFSFFSFFTSPYTFLFIEGYTEGLQRFKNKQESV